MEQAGGNLPARISLLSFPSRTELRQKNLFSVAGAHFFRYPCQVLLGCARVFVRAAPSELASLGPTCWLQVPGVP